QFEVQLSPVTGTATDVRNGQRERSAATSIAINKAILPTHRPDPLPCLLLSLGQVHETALQRRSIGQAATPQDGSVKTSSGKQSSSAPSLAYCRIRIRGRAARQRTVGDERDFAPDLELAGRTGTDIPSDAAKGGSYLRGEVWKCLSMGR